MSAVSLGQIVTNTAVIPISTTTSDAITTNGLSLVGIYIPAAFTGTSLNFLVSETLGGTYVPLYNKSGEVTYTVAPAQFLAIAPIDFYGVPFLKIVSNSSEAAARSLACALKGI